MRYAFIVNYPSKVMEVNFQSNTTKVLFPVTSPFNPPYLKCIYMVEKYVNIRAVIYFLTINVNMVG